MNISYHPATRLARTVPPAGTPEFHSWAADLGVCIDRDGFRCVAGPVDALARQARDLHLETVAASVLADADAPDVARARAFSRVVAALGALQPATGVAAAVA